MKKITDPKDLAYMGCQPAFAQPLHVGRPNMGPREKFLELVNETFDEGWFTNDGPKVQELERTLAQKLGVQHCIAMCNGTVALEIAIRALDLDGEVIVPSYTFIATAHALSWQGIKPVFADINPENHNISPESVREKITENTSGVIGVHLWGRPSPIEQLQELADEHHFKLLFDAAHAFGCTHNSEPIGQFGNCEVFSFHATKIFNTFEGGAIATNDDNLAGKVRLMRNFGFSGYDNVVYTGTNGKMSEISAAMGLCNLQSYEEFRSRNRENHRLYKSLLAELPELRLLDYNNAEQNNFHYIVVELGEGYATSRDLVVDVLVSENVLARKYFWPGCHMMKPYLQIHGSEGSSLPQTDAVARSVIVLPNGGAVGLQEISVITDILKLLCKQDLSVALGS